MFNNTKFNQINDFIEKKAKKKVKIVAVSKNHPVSSVMEAINAGVMIFGENRVQEAQDKFLSIKQKYKEIELHLTGPLQTNKVKQALKIFDVFQTLDREKLAKEFYKHSENLKNKSFFIQVNIGKEASKSGIDPENADGFIKYCLFDLGLNVVGLMCIPPVNDDPLYHFNSLKEISLRNKIDKLSMGMSADYEKGIYCGATHVRIGTKIFGNRNDL